MMLREKKCADWSPAQKQLLIIALRPGGVNNFTIPRGFAARRALGRCPLRAGKVHRLARIADNRAHARDFGTARHAAVDRRCMKSLSRRMVLSPQSLAAQGVGCFSAGAKSVYSHLWIRLCIVVLHHRSRPRSQAASRSRRERDIFHEHSSRARGRQPQASSSERKSRWRGHLRQCARGLCTEATCKLCICA
jgi:hypothetical protein